MPATRSGRTPLRDRAVPEEILPTPVAESARPGGCGGTTPSSLLLEEQWNNAVKVKEEQDERSALSTSEGWHCGGVDDMSSRHEQSYAGRTCFILVDEEPEEIVPSPTGESTHSSECGDLPTASLCREGRGDNAVAVKKEPEELVPSPPDESMHSSDCGDLSTASLHLEGRNDNAVAVKKEPDDSAFLRIDEGSSPGAFDSASSSQVHPEGQLKNNPRRVVEGQVARSTVRGGPNKKRRFTVQEDIWLLREVVDFNPYEDSTRWTMIADAVNHVSGQAFTSRAARERTERLLMLFHQQDTANLRKSGTEEQYSEKEVLLQEVAELARSFPSTRKKQNSVAATALQATPRSPGGTPEAISAPVSPLAESVHPKASSSGEAAHATEGVSPPTSYTSQGPSVRHGKRKTLEATMDMVTARARRDIRQLALEERRLKLEEEKLQLERDRYENIELVRVRLEVEEQRDRALIRQQRDDKHRAAMERELVHMQLLKAMLDKISP